MDEIGFIITHIDEDGFLRFHTLGGFDPKTHSTACCCAWEKRRDRSDELQANSCNDRGGKKQTAQEFGLLY